MTDREMTILAAKAMGLVLDLSVRPDGEPFYHSERRAIATEDGDWFGPLADDGDCARMEAKLDIDVRWNMYVFPEIWNIEVGVTCGEIHGTMNASEPYGADKQAARRRASVRVAAMMGEKMP